MKVVNLEQRAANYVSLDDFNKLWPNAHIIVYFYATWCNKSKLLQPTWNKLKTTLPKEYDGNIIFAEIDSNSIRNLPTSFFTNISGFPSIIYVVNGVIRSEFRKSSTTLYNLKNWTIYSLGNILKHKNGKNGNDPKRIKNRKNVKPIPPPLPIRDVLYIYKTGKSKTRANIY